MNAISKTANIPGQILRFSPERSSFISEKDIIKKTQKDNKSYNLLKWFMKTERFDDDPFIPAWVKAAVHTAERIGTVAVIGLFLGWLNITLLTRDDDRNNKFLAMTQQTNLTLQELTVAVHELKVSFENKR